MASIQLTGTPRLCPEQYKDLNMAEYSRQVFGMFGGRETMVRLLFPMELINNAVDRFGSGAMLVPQGSHLFHPVRPRWRYRRCSFPGSSALAAGSRSLGRSRCRRNTGPCAEERWTIIFES